MEHKQYSLFPCRFQVIPPHEGHQAILQFLLDEGLNILICLRKEDGTKKNPYTVAQRTVALEMLYAKEISEGRIVIIGIPDITEVVHGRNVGWKVRKIKLPTRIESVSATQIRAAKLLWGDIAEKGIGLSIWFTGLPCSGKSSTANSLADLLEAAGHKVTLLDGDEVRMLLSKGLGFTRADRNANILRIGFVASEVVKHGGVAICAAVSPYRETRGEIRKQIGEQSFIEVFVDTPLKVCEQRDMKGLYAKARRGEIENFTGISDPYEAPVQPNMVLDTINCGIEDNAHMILDYIRDFLTRARRQGGV